MVNPYGNLLEETVLAASPMELTRMLFDKLLAEIRTAKECLARGEVVRRNASAARATDIVLELAASLDDAQGGDLSRSLRQVYTYALEQLIEGNTGQRAVCFENAERVIAPLADAWDELTGQDCAPSVDPGCLSPVGVDGMHGGAFSFSG